jgi:hypothetical protein
MLSSTNGMIFFTSRGDSLTSGSLTSGERPPNIVESVLNCRKGLSCINAVLSKLLTIKLIILKINQRRTCVFLTTHIKRLNLRLQTDTSQPGLMALAINCDLLSRPRVSGHYLFLVHRGCCYRPGARLHTYSPFEADVSVHHESPSRE